MKYYFDCDKWGSVFSVPSCVANNCLKLCDGAFLKVLIYALAQNSHELEGGQIASACGVSESVVDDAFKYWQSCGVLSSGEIKPAAPAAAAPKTEQVGTVRAIDPTAANVGNKLAIRYTNSEILEKTKNDKDLAHLLSEIQSVLKRTINSTEQGELIALYEYYGFTVPSILLTAQYCFMIEKTRIAYLVQIMKSWYEKDITTYDKIEKEIIRASAARDYQNRVLKAFGIVTKPTPTQVEYIKSWQEMGFTIEMLEIAYNKCMDNTNKLNFKYINTILTNWASKSISTPAQVNEEDSKFKSRKADTSSTKSTSYDLDEFERFARGFDLSKAKKV